MNGSKGGFFYFQISDCVVGGVLVFVVGKRRGAFVVHRYMTHVDFSLVYQFRMKRKPCINIQFSSSLNSTARVIRPAPWHTSALSSTCGSAVHWRSFSPQGYCTPYPHNLDHRQMPLKAIVVEAFQTLEIDVETSQVDATRAYKKLALKCVPCLSPRCHIS